jgi:hypothetical protein
LEEEVLREMEELEKMDELDELNEALRYGTCDQGPPRNLNHF